MAKRIDFRTLKRTVGRDGNVRLPGTIIPMEEWTRWNNPGAYIDQKEVELVIDGETVGELVEGALKQAIKVAAPAIEKAVGKAAKAVVNAAGDAAEAIGDVVEDAVDAVGDIVEKAVHPKKKNKG